MQQKLEKDAARKARWTIKIKKEQKIIKLYKHVS